jgi:dienelactone hydrolase
MITRRVRHRWPIVLVGVCLAALPLVAQTQTQATTPTPSPTPVLAPTAHAAAVVDALAARAFEKVTSQFDAAMKAGLDDDKLRAAWDGIVTQVGAFVRRAPGQEQPRGAYTAVTVQCEFQRAKVDVTVVFNASGQISGLQMKPAASATPYSTPPYVTTSAFKESEVTVGSGEWAVPGTIAMPVGTGPFPAVVLVHGSGPNDRDESFGPNKTFKDVALGLATRGIAVLRYDKRTKVHQAKLVNLAAFTVKDESIDDTLLAIGLLRANPLIDPAKIFVIGHSLGGMLIPRIAAADPKIAGVVVMAGAVRSLEQSILDQLQYLAEADGVVSPEEGKQIEGARQLVGIVAKLTPEDAKSGKDLSGAPASYWLDLRGYDPPAVAARLPQRVLVLQGARDYQVTVADFERWKTGLATKKNAEFKLYPTLNHLFLPGTGKSLPTEYSTPGHVPVEVIDDIAAWIKK